MIWLGSTPRMRRGSSRPRAIRSPPISSGVIAILCAGAGDIGVAMSARAKAVGLPVNVMDDLAHSTFIFPAIVDRGDVVVAVGTGGTSPVVARRVRERIEAVLPARIGDLAAFIGSFRKSMHARIPEFPLRRRFWERVIDGPIGALVLAGRKDEAEKALNEIADPVRLRRRERGRQGRGQGDAGRRRSGRSGSAHHQGAARAAGCRRRFLRRTGLAGNSRSRPPRCLAHSGRPPRRQARHRPGCDQQAADRGREVRTARGAAEGRRSLHLRPRRRGNRSAARGRRRLFGGAGHYRRARRRRAIRGAADLSGTRRCASPS